MPDELEQAAAKRQTQQRKMMIVLAACVACGTAVLVLPLLLGAGQSVFGRFLPRRAGTQSKTFSQQMQEARQTELDKRQQGGSGLGSGRGAIPGGIQAFSMPGAPAMPAA